MGSKNRLTKVNVVFSLLAMIALTVSCQEKKAPAKAPAKKPGNGAVDTGNSGDANPDSSVLPTTDSFTVVITPVTQAGPTFNFGTGQQVLVKFTISGPTSSSDVSVGLLNPVTGGSLSASNALSPEFSWNPGSLTQADFRLVVRNKAKCLKLAASPSTCEMKSGQAVSANSQYDTQSNLYTVKIGNTSVGGTTTGGSSAIIQTILGMMTGGGTGAPGNLAGILSSMSGGQLSTLLATLQGTGGTGGTGDLMSILTSIMGGMTLTGEPIPGAVVIDPSAADGLSLTRGN